VCARWTQLGHAVPVIATPVPRGIVPGGLSSIEFSNRIPRNEEKCKHWNAARPRDVFCGSVHFSTEQNALCKINNLSSNGRAIIGDREDFRLIGR
jgi:hypothetical protein